MTLVIRNVVDGGDAERERLILKATDDADLGDYVVLVVGTTKSGDISTRVRHAFWFPYKSLKKDDLVVIYTKGGKSREKELVSGATAYFYYWDVTGSIWNDTKLHAVLLRAPNFSSKSAEELTAE